ncbi:MAG: translocation/assembly module TamB domain-containing protein [Acidobacteriota bacterium]|nr:translocation/assembly module TamB domain-containing protein [Blastocatellia bacterium]MDW8413632.1 translocation/assembly module TamB domain-containing protein [Acidobacteriota bacterium]
MKKIALRLLIITPVAVAAVAVIGFLWLESDYFASLLGQQLKLTATKYNLCLSYSSLRFRPLRLQIEIEDLSLNTCEKPQSVKIDKVYLGFRLSTRSGILLDTLTLRRPVVNLQVPEQGFPEFEATALPQESSLHQVKVTIDDGELIWNDSAHRIQGQLSDLTLSAQPIGHKLKVGLAAAEIKLSYDDKKVLLDRLEAQMMFNRGRLEVERAELLSSGTQVHLSGSIGLQILSYNLQLFSRIDLKALSEFTAGIPLAGTITVRGKIEGQGSAPQFRGMIESKTFNIAEINASGLRLNTEAVLPLLSSFLELEHLEVGNILAKKLSARVLLNDQKLEIKDIYTKTSSGTIKGQLSISLTDDISTLRCQIDDISLIEIARIWPTLKHLQIAANIDGNILSKWRGLKLSSASTDLAFDFTATVPSIFATNEQLSGNLRGKLKGNLLSIDQASLIAGSSQLSIKGEIGPEVDVQVDGATGKLEELLSLAVYSGVVAAEVKESRLQAHGAAKFYGRVTGSLAAPEIIGKVELGSLQAEGIELGKFAADIRISAKQIAVTGGSLRQADGGKVDVDFDGAARQVKLEISDYEVTPALTNLARRKLLEAQLLPVVTLLQGYEGKISGRLSLLGVPTLAELAEGNINIKQVISGLTGKGAIHLTNRAASKFKQIDFTFDLANSNIRIRDLAAELPAAKIFGSFSYELSASRYDVNLDIDLDAKQLNIGLPVEGQLQAKLRGSGQVSEPSLELNLHSSKLKIGPALLDDVRLESQVKDSTATGRLKASYSGHLHEITAKLKLEDDLPMEAEMVLQDSPIVPLLAPLFDVPPRLIATANGKVLIRGPISTDEGLSTAKLKARIELDKLDLKVKKLKEDDLEYSATNDGQVLVDITADQVKVLAFRLKGEKTSLTVTGNYNFGSTSQLELRGQLNLGLLSTLSRSLFADGTASLAVQLVGISRDGPLIKGVADLQNASIRYVGLPLAISDGNGKVVFNSDRLVLDSFTAKAGGGRVRLAGGLRFDKDDPTFRLAIQAEEVKVSYPAGARTMLSGNLTLQGTKKLQVLSGNIDITQFDYRENTDLASILAAETQLVVDPTTESTVKLDVSINAQDTLSVNNNIAELTASAALKLTGPINNPIVSGKASVTRGTLFLRNERYQINRGLFFFSGTRSRQVQFDIESETNIRGYRILLNLNGSLNKLNVSFRSEPALSQLDIVRLLTTGQPPTNIGQVQTAGTVSSARIAADTAAGILFGTLSSKVEQQTDRLFGLNRFQIDPLLTGRGSNPTARITLGRRISRNLSVTYSTDLSTGREQIFLIEYQLKNNLSLVGVRSEDGSYGFEVRLRKQF